MNKISKRFFVLSLIIALMVSSISGCQLAKEEGQYENSEILDQLIGVMITVGELPDEKVYGETYVEDGVIKVKFDIDNAMVAYKVQGVDYVELDFNEHIHYEKINLYNNDKDGVVDKKEEYILKMFYEKEADGVIIYLNPIYKDNDNKIYVGEAAYGEYINHIGELSHYISNCYEHDKDGGKEKHTTTFKVNIVDGVVHDEVNIISMTNDSMEISRTEYAIDELNGDIKVSNKASYIIVEKLHNGEVVEREIINKTEEGKRILITEKGKNGFLIPRHIEVDWIEN